MLYCVFGCLILLLFINRADICVFSLCITDNQYIIIRSFYSFGGELTDLILSISLLILFVKKLNQVTESLYILSSNTERDFTNITRSNTDTSLPLVLNEAKTSEITPSVDTLLSNLDNKKQNMLNVMSKIFILSTIMIIATQFALMFSILLSIFELLLSDTVDNDPRYVGYVNDIFALLKIIDCFISSLVLFLYFEFTQKWYIKLCGKCHQKVKERQIRKIQNRVSVYNQIQQ